MDYSKTVNLPKTDFPMRANLNTRELEIIKYWDEINLYQKLIDKNKNNNPYILHDGPPYANGNIHIGHALNKILKDIIVKYKCMRGFYTPFVPGWDCHGMPIEHKVIELLGAKHKQMQKKEIRDECKKYALKHIEIQKKDFIRLGCIGEWENPYLTLDPVYESAIIEMFGELVEKGYIYKGLKPVHWCFHCETALADAEVEYDNHSSSSIYVRFKIKNKNNLDLPDNTYFIIWTTTPWTLPANVAIALHPEFVYNLVLAANNYYIIVDDLTENVAKRISADFKIIKQYKGSELEKIICSHPFIDRDSVIINADYVTKDTGTGAVHIAPGHGEEDFIAGKIYKLPTISPVDNQGKFTNEFSDCKGINVFDANKLIINKLKQSNDLIGDPETIEHQYPHCWRCKNPIIFRATHQWFLKVDHLNLRKKILDCIDNNVNWIPNWGKDRISAMVKLRPDWCLSRQRIWGVPIPVMYCKNCQEVLISKKCIDYFKNLVEKYGVDSWFTMTASELLPPDTKCEKCGSAEFEKETDILDVWFDSGASHIAVLEKREYLSSPADLYLEGSDQHRGWFQLSLIPSYATRGRAPFKSVLTHGFVVDESGKKMSKSEGNVVSPQDIINKYGSDILRLWTSYEDYRNDVSIGGDIINRIVESYKKIRNTMRFLISNLYDFNRQNDYVEYDKLLEMDKWTLAKLYELNEKITSAYNEFKFHTIYHSIYNFCIKELSSFYLDILKERLYLSGSSSIERRAAQTVL
ncbi:MAG TPA: isoleucine--tRNA ligase, partial [bacterium]|nr:isoleucine--tRNA ligase [bacterium]